MKNVNVFVTQEHIDNSEIESTENCMVANALIDAGFKNVSVRDCEFYACEDKYGTPEVCFEHSTFVQEKIRFFDSLLPVEPFSFVVENVNEKYLVNK